MIVADRYGEQDRGRPYGPGQVRDQGDGVRVCPMQVLKQQQAAGGFARDGQKPQQTLAEHDHRIRSAVTACPGAALHPERRTSPTRH